MRTKARRIGIGLLLVVVASAVLALPAWAGAPGERAEAQVNPALPTVTKTVVTTFTRTYCWAIDKEGDEESLLLSSGQQYLVNYSVEVGLDTDDCGPNGYVDSNWQVSGVITVQRGNTNVYIGSVSDLITPGNIAATVNCAGITFPRQLTTGQPSFTCTYSASLPDGTSRTNTATVTTTSGPPNHNLADTVNSVGYAVTFVTPTTEVDECIDVEDDLEGDLGTVCVEALPADPFEYSLPVGPYEECDEYEFVNTASFVTNDTEADGEDSWTVDVEVTGCNGGGDLGCTLSKGYWKTHSAYGPAPYDDAWDGDEDTAFFSSGKSWYEVFWAPPAGDNVYYILAHQYLAALLNIANGADPTDAQDALDDAEDLFNTYSPNDVAAFKGKNANVQRAPFLTLAGALGEYNSGVSGPGCCSEELVTLSLP